MSHLLVESSRRRRLVGQLGRGEQLLQGILSLCDEQQVRCGVLAASGTLENLALSHYDAAARQMGKPRQLHGPLQLLSAQGFLSEERGRLHLQLSVVASRQGDNGIELFGGVCTEAKVLSCSLTIESFEDVLLRRDRDRHTGLSVWSEAIAAGDSLAPEQADEQPPVAGPSPAHLSWAQVVEASEHLTVVPASAARPLTERGSEEQQGAAQEEEELTDRPVQAGDILDHQHFGRCLVQRVDADQEFVTVRLRNGRLVRLSLEVLELSFLGEEDGHQVFRTTSAGG